MLIYIIIYLAISVFFDIIFGGIKIYDAIVIGTGAGGSTVVKDLSQQEKIS